MAKRELIKLKGDGRYIRRRQRSRGGRTKRRTLHLRPSWTVASHERARTCCTDSSSLQFQRHCEDCWALFVFSAN
jgi:hypothetical protein